jgi:hypothetical protein
LRFGHLSYQRRRFWFSFPSGTAILKWLSGEALYVTLPIGIIYLIYLVTDHSLADVLLWKEWGIGSIVLTGAAGTEYVRIKGQLQRAFDVRLIAGLRFLNVLLVASSLALALVVLHETGITFGNETLLGYIQMALFVTAMAATILVTHARTVFETIPEAHAGTLTLDGASDYFLVSLDRTVHDLKRLERILIQHPAHSNALRFDPAIRAQLKESHQSLRLLRLVDD